MYRSKEYSERPWEDMKTEIDMMAGYLPDTKRVFLADGDALNTLLVSGRYPAIISISAFTSSHGLSEYSFDLYISQKEHSLNEQPKVT